MSPYPSVPYRMPRLEPEAMLERAQSFFELLNARRSVRSFSDEPVPRELVEVAIRTASTAPSGAHRQPWKFVAVSDPQLKREIRVAAEKEEYEFYEGGRASDEWIDALRPLGTSWEKPFLEKAPWVVVVFEVLYDVGPGGEHLTNYYTKESVGIACGLFVTALHNMGLATLTHTPSPMKFLSRILNRPGNERPYILFPVGYPASGAQVPQLQRKPLEAVSVWREAPPSQGEGR